MELWEFLKDIKDEIEERIKSFEPIDIDYIPQPEDMKLEIGKWYRIKDVVCVYVDLKDSTKASFVKTKESMSKVYEYIGTSIVKVFSNSNFKSAFIDIKGDGGFALYKEPFAEVKALLAAVTFKTFAYKYMRNRFSNIQMKFGIGMAKGNLLVKKVGKRGNHRNFPVWAGKVVNHAAWICKDVKKSFDFECDVLGITEGIYRVIKREEFKEWLFLSCPCPNGKKTELWKEKDLEGREKYFYLKVNWCDKHGEEYLNNVLEKLKELESEN
jgi:hypothetical protein